MKTTNRKKVRQQFKALGYRVSFSRNLFNDELVALGFKNADMLKFQYVYSSTCFPANFLKAHDKALKLVQSLEGYYLEDTDQKITI